MNIDLYVKQSERTQADAGQAQDRASERDFDLIHIALGLQDEVGEFAKAIKGHLFYGKELDRTNLIEELGDIAWFWAYACRELQVAPGDVLETNIKKLKARYPEKFDSKLANERALDIERKILEGLG